jgi:signal transduction histidine kinase
MAQNVTQNETDRRLQAHSDAEFAKERVQVIKAQDRFQVRMGTEREQEQVQVSQAQERFQVVMATERAKERVQVHKAQDRFQDRMREEREHEQVQVAEAQERFQAVMGAERAKERVQVNEAQDRFQVRMGAEREQEQLQVNDAQDRFQVRMGEEREQEQLQVNQAQDRFKVVTATGAARARTDREQLQAQLNQGQRLEVLGQLAGGIAHDFNNLLAVILNYATFVVDDLAERGPELAETSRDVGQIQRAAERAADLTQQLLAFARREIVQFQVIDVNHVITELEELLRRTLGDEVVLGTDLTPDLWPVLGDAGQFEQVLVNLAVNARDAMSGGGTLNIDTANVIVDTETEALLRGGRHIRLRVTDTGTGMPPDIIERAFEPFFTTKGEGAGTGLGLSTVYGAVTQAEGTINISSSPGIGTTFTILVPATDEIAVSETDAALPYEPVATGETVLIVEDQEALREVTERIFTRAGYRVITAANGNEAVTLAARHDGDIHLLLTDVVMPNMLGKEVAERIRLLKPAVEVLFMSGYAQPVLASQGRLDRDVNLIEKPFTAASIIEKTGRILSGHHDGLTTVKPPDDEA